jgi:hypothetical protein
MVKKQRTITSYKIVTNNYIFSIDNLGSELEKRKRKTTCMVPEINLETYMHIDTPRASIEVSIKS